MHCILLRFLFLSFLFFFKSNSMMCLCCFVFLSINLILFFRTFKICSLMTCQFQKTFHCVIQMFLLHNSFAPFPVGAFYTYSRHSHYILCVFFSSVSFQTLFYIFSCDLFLGLTSFFPVLSMAVMRLTVQESYCSISCASWCVHGSSLVVAVHSLG